ncbi:endoplasmic reticulum resident protein 44 isoform X1 [Toxorhynchites rutilus septentrionalis]|uniref:endoplasmic reticulum resident protein 44 isoform X1 n=2 Tax=Toxorhynchites rutilus septentrionalis TaxID=329112 RepID=UPI00247AAD8A|nr:endoplasmic reticulum resident protein 44 isoform X1 [Toxorhynchites rutilus septentrionalis]
MSLLSSGKITIFSFLMIAYLFYNPTDSGAVQLNNDNFAMTIASNELVFINFYAEWCRFSNILQPIFDEAADKVREAFPEAGRVVMGKVDCDKESAVATRFHISKYPTLKIIRNGQPTKREYRGARTVEAFTEFVKKQLEDPIKEFHNLKDLEILDTKKRIVIGYFDRRDMPEYNMFRRVATNLKEDCVFNAGFGDTVAAMHPPGQPIIVFRPDVAVTDANDETFKGDMKNFDDLHVWIQQKCVPLVREITFENAEELTEEGLPFLILFHAPDDLQSIKDYKTIVETQLISEKQNINFLTADGKRFAHPLHHLGKGPSDLPLIAIDSFRHMYLFPEYKDIFVPGKLKQFLSDLYSGKLHREFHYGPERNDDNTIEVVGIEIHQDVKKPTTPPESTFKNLGPSNKRYTLLKDEL